MSIFDLFSFASGWKEERREKLQQFNMEVEKTSYSDLRKNCYINYSLCL